MFFCQVTSLPYRTVGNALFCTFILWVLIASAAVPIWFAHHLEAKTDVREPPKSERTEAEVDSGLANVTMVDVEGENLHWCRFSEDDYSRSGFSVSFFVSGYAIPLLLIVVMYIYMLRRLWHPVSHQVS